MITVSLLLVVIGIKVSRFSRQIQVSSMVKTASIKQPWDKVERDIKNYPDRAVATLDLRSRACTDLLMSSFKGLLGLYKPVLTQ